MQKYTVVAGMNGAGLMNCIYLPPTSTCVQLVPYGAKTHLNFEDYGKLLKLRGPYAEWHNRHEEMNVVNQGPHTSDTTVHITELVKVIKEAMEFAKIAREKLEKSDDFISPRVPSDDEKLNKIDSKVEL
jgi:protein O-GlcNAc transferase